MCKRCHPKGEKALLSLDHPGSLSESDASSPKAGFRPATLPELLAPAGGREQFLAALNAGADAIYLGLKSFNARSRAANFTIEELANLMPLARAYGVKVLVTLNILLKEAELPTVVELLSELEWLGIHAVIVQDLGLARLIRGQFPSLRMHASTQLAIHNLEGVKEAQRLGFKRVVLARELTAQEWRLIHQYTATEGPELEVFCHGSLCYSYSGLCFFSGAEDARSGNRGECAYTCRVPYRIKSEPGHGFLFSMKDLDTSRDVEAFLKAGVSTLKIEGRKKDAQYVGTVVALYRRELDRLATMLKLEPHRPEQKRQDFSGFAQRDLRLDLRYSFQRQSTSFFVNGRYHENVIDLNSPGHEGVFIGEVNAIRPGYIRLKTKEPLERFDGLRIEPKAKAFHALPQHGQHASSDHRLASRKYHNETLQFSLRRFRVMSDRKTPQVKANAGDVVEIEIPANADSMAIGDRVYKVRSNELKQYIEQLTKQNPEAIRMRALQLVNLQIEVRRSDPESVELLCNLSLGQTSLGSVQRILSVEQPQSQANLEVELLRQLSMFGDIGIEAHLSIRGDLNWHVRAKAIKELKRTLKSELLQRREQHRQQAQTQALASLSQPCSGYYEPHLKTSSASLCIKTDRVHSIESLIQISRKGHLKTPVTELIFEPKRAFQSEPGAADIDRFWHECQKQGWTARLALPTVLRAWDMRLLRLWIDRFLTLGGTHFEIGNLGGLGVLRQYCKNLNDLNLSADFTMYALNSQAVAAIRDLGMRKLALSVEDDRSNIKAKLDQWPQTGISAQIILYKDTPLFIAEACSLTALHGGCPTAEVCGYRSLEIENEAGDEYIVAHESCKSIVYGKRAFAITEARQSLQEMGIRDFRIDFLTRDYAVQDMEAVLQAVDSSYPLADSQRHPANFYRHLK